MVGRLREQNKIEDGVKRESVPGDSEALGILSDHGALSGWGLLVGDGDIYNQAIPHTPEGFEGFDFLQPETRGRELRYATDEWEDYREKDGKAAFRNVVEVYAKSCKKKKLKVIESSNMA